MFIPSCFLYVHVSFWKFLTLLPIVLPPLKYFAMCLIKRYKGKSIFQQQQIYRKKKVYQRLAICRQYPFF